MADAEDSTTQLMISSAGKSTNSLYLAFQDKEKHKMVQSKVAQFMGISQKHDGAANDHNGLAARGPIANIIEQERKGRRRILDGGGGGGQNSDFSAQKLQEQKAKNLQVEMNKIEKDIELNKMSEL